MTDRFASVLALAVTIAATLGIGLLTLTPVPAAAPPGGDKLHHVLAFAALVLPGVALRPGWTPALCLFGFAYGGAIELVQPWAGRSRELADWLADVIGVGAGALAGRVLFALAFRRFAGAADDDPLERPSVTSRDGADPERG